jgi:hypothetical protein
MDQCHPDDSFPSGFDKTIGRLSTSRCSNDAAVFVDEA